MAALWTLTLFVILLLVFEAKVALLTVWVVLDYGWIYFLGSIIHYLLIMLILRWVCGQLGPIGSMDFTLSTHDNVRLELLSKSLIERHWLTLAMLLLVHSGQDVLLWIEHIVMVQEGASRALADQIMGEVYLMAFPLLVLMLVVLVEVWLALVAIVAQESTYWCHVWVGVPSVGCVWE
jgi:hypothetical protein